MYQTQHQNQPSSFPEIPYYSQSQQPSSIPIPPHFTSLSSDPSFSHCLPNPYPHPYPYPPPPAPPPNVTAFEAQPAPAPGFYTDPNVVSPSWVIKQAAPVKYSSAIQPLNKEAIASTSYDASLTNYDASLTNYDTSLTNYGASLTSYGGSSLSYDASLTSNRVRNMSVRNAFKKKLKRPKAIPKKTSVGKNGQNVRCDLCKIDCNDIHMYEKHISGKKHTKNLNKICAASVVQASKSTKDSTLGGQVKSGVSSVPADLQSKKQKLLSGGADVQSVKVCTICNVACNGEIVFADHLAGKKHIAQERALHTMANPNTISASNPVTNSQKNTISASNPVTTSRKNTISASNLVTNSEKKTTEKSKNEPCAWCEVCKISCTSVEGLLIHRVGKKHKKKLEKLINPKKDTIAPASTAAPSPSTNPPTAAPENAEPAKETAVESQKAKMKVARSNEPEDVETKKRKVLVGGAAAEAVRTCTVCNVVCNSETVFKSHLAGQKHGAMVKQAGAGKG